MSFCRESLVGELSIPEDVAGLLFWETSKDQLLLRRKRVLWDVLTSNSINLLMWSTGHNELKRFLCHDSSRLSEHPETLSSANKLITLSSSSFASSTMKPTSPASHLAAKDLREWPKCAKQTRREIKCPEWYCELWQSAFHEMVLMRSALSRGLHGKKFLGWIPANWNHFGREMESVKEPGEENGSPLSSPPPPRLALLQPRSRVICLLVSLLNLIMWNNNNF